MGYSSQQAKAFIQEIAPSAQKAYKELGKVLPSVCIGMAIVESGAGTSKVMRNHNAILGQKVGSGKTATKYWDKTFFNARTSEEYTIGVHTPIKDNFRSYRSLEQCIFNYYELLNSSVYKKVLAGVDYKTQMMQIKKCGYMTSSTEVDTVINRINKYDLTKYDNISVSVEKSYVVGKTYTTTSNLYVRKTPNGEKLTKEQLTFNAQLYAFEDDEGKAILKKGTRVTCKEVQKLTDSTWILIPSGWVCAILAGKVYIR